MGAHFGKPGQIFIGDTHIADLSHIDFFHPEPLQSKLWLPGDDELFDSPLIYGQSPLGCFGELPSAFGFGFQFAASGLWLPKSVVGPSFAVCTYTTPKSALKGTSISELLAVKETLDAMKKSQESQKPMSLFGLPVVEVPFLSNDLPTGVEYHFSPDKYQPSMQALKDQFLKQFMGTAFYDPSPFGFLSPLTIPRRRRQLAHDDWHLFFRPDARSIRRQAEEQEILRKIGDHDCEYVWSEWLQMHVQIGESL